MARHIHLTHFVGARLTEAEDGWLTALAKHYALTPSAVVRMLVKREFESVQAERDRAASTRPEGPRRKKT